MNIIDLKNQLKRRVGMLAVIVVLLSIPAIAMQFTNEVDWKTGDFIVMGIMLILTFLLIEVSIRAIKNRSIRTMMIILFVVLFLLTWAELGVGIFGTPFAGN